MQRPEGAFYQFVRTPGDDDEQFTAALAARDVFVLPRPLARSPLTIWRAPNT